MIYLYLARRDKMGVKLISTIPGHCLPARVANTHTLQLSLAQLESLNKIVHENRMLWELWMEGAENFETLCDALHHRGFVMPSSPQTIIHIQQIKVDNTQGQRTMMKRNSI